VDEVIKVARKTPFEPFTIHMSDGSQYPVRHPEQMVISRRALYVGTNDGDIAAAFDDVVICDLIHVTRLTPGVPRRSDSPGRN